MKLVIRLYDFDWLDTTNKDEIIEVIRSYLQPQYSNTKNAVMIDELIKDQLKILKINSLKFLTMLLTEEHGYIYEKWK